MASLSRRLRRSQAAKATPGTVSGKARSVAWLGALAEAAGVPKAVLVDALGRMSREDIARQLRGRIAARLRKARARDKVAWPWETVAVDPAIGKDRSVEVKIRRVPRPVRPDGGGA